MRAYRWYETRPELVGQDLLADSGIMEVLESARAALMDAVGNVTDCLHVRYVYVYTCEYTCVYMYIYKYVYVYIRVCTSVRGANGRLWKRY